MIYFCIPTLNEERTVGVVLWKLRQVMTELQRDFQIVVVDDASTDATQEVLNPYLRVLPLTLIRNQKQLGYAASLEIAIREAVRRSPYPKRDALITLQADFTEDPDAVPALIKRIEAGADLVTTTPLLDESTPPNIRRSRKLFRWLVRGREWAELGDPFCGLRAYRVMTVKRAIEARGTGRLLSWEGLAANAELAAQTMPHSRRNDTIEATLHYKRLQRASRFKFMPMLKQVMGVRGGKPGKALPVELPESTIVVPAALAVELATGHQRQQQRNRQETRRPRPAGNGRGPRREEGRPRQAKAQPREETQRERPARPPRQPRPPREQREPKPEQTETPIEASLVEVTAGAAPAPEREKKRRRPRRRGKKQGQRDPQQQPGEATSGEAPSGEATNGEATEGAPLAAGGPAAEGEAGAPRKKSRRGRRGGRGRRRAPRAGEEAQSTDNIGDNGESGGTGEITSAEA